MKRNDVLKRFASQYKMPARIFEDRCRDSKPKQGIPTMELINGGAVLGDFAGYLKKENSCYEPCEYQKVKFLEDGCIGVEVDIPVSYTRRGEILQGIDNS
jgi:hypothetical protein